MEETTTKNQEFVKKIKNKNKKATIYFFSRVLFVFIIFALLAGYLLSPLSNSSILALNGAYYLTKEDIYQILHIQESTSIYHIDEQKSNELLNNHPLIQNAKIHLDPFHFNIQMDEIAPGGLYNGKYYLTNGTIFDLEKCQDQIILEYYQTKISNQQIATFVNEPIEKESQYYTQFLSLVALENSKNHSIQFIESTTSEKSFIFYYFLNSNFAYMRVKLNYNDSFSKQEYAQVLSKDIIQHYADELYTSLNEVELKSYLHEMTLGENTIQYIDSILTLKRNESGQIVEVFDYL